MYFIFRHLKSWCFRHSKRIARFKSIYSNFPEPVIRTYLKSFEINAARIEEVDLGDDLDKILNQYFLVKESSPLQFTKSKSVIRYSDDWEKISEDYFKLYFPEEFLIEVSSELPAKSI